MSIVAISLTEAVKDVAREEGVKISMVTGSFLIYWPGQAVIFRRAGLLFGTRTGTIVYWYLNTVPSHFQEPFAETRQDGVSRRYIPPARCLLCLSPYSILEAHKIRVAFSM